jgi:ADP-heptose:LPS heptosyltransferase
VPSAFKNVVTRRLATLWSRPRLTPHEFIALRPRRILLVRQHNQMGDMVCATPCFRAIKQTWPDAELALVTAAVNRQVVEGNPHLSRIFLFDRIFWRRPAALFAFLHDLRRFDAELTIVLNSVSFSSTSAFLALWSPARWVVGGDGAPFGSQMSRAYSLRLPTNPTIDRHAIDHGLAPLAAVGVTTGDRSTVIVPSATDRRQAADIITRLLPEGPFWVMHPGAGKPQNCWPAARFAEMAGRAARAGHPVLVLHGPADGPVLADFVDSVKAVPGQAPVAVAPAISVSTSAALLERADRFLCNDTGIMHVAGALKVPTLALFGATDPALWKPPVEQVRAFRSPSRMVDDRGAEFGWMESLDEEAVWQAWCAMPGRSFPQESKPHHLR